MIIPIVTMLGIALPGLIGGDCDAWLMSVYVPSASSSAPSSCSCSQCLS
jgi:hypothetical protein